MTGTGTVGGNGKLDSRTRLPDRDRFYVEVAPQLDDAAARGASVVLIGVDVDGLDFILRTFGPRERDELVREVGERIREATGGEGTPYHIAQGRFSVVLPGTSYRHATRRARSLIAALRLPFDVAGISYQLEAHAGIGHFPNHGRTVEELVRTAVFACHQARQSLQDYTTFDRELDERERHRFRLMVDLDHALEQQDGIRLAYQPQVDLATGACAAVEGLCRWDHPTMGIVEPEEFLPYVEHTPLMMPLTEATLSRSLEDLASLRGRGFDGAVAINVSPALFRRADLLDRLVEHLRFSNVAAERLHFEVTETGIMDQPNRAIQTLTAIRERGSPISVDDFGTGHSSLAYIGDLPIDTIKIDRYFVQNLDRPWGEAIVGATATLADKLGLTTIAEGIEQPRQQDKCRELGVDLGQGFHIGYPMFEEDLQEWLGL